jgi:hypothetical protein
VAETKDVKFPFFLDSVTTAPRSGLGHGGGYRGQRITLSRVPSRCAHPSLLLDLPVLILISSSLSRLEHTLDGLRRSSHSIFDLFATLSTRDELLPHSLRRFFLRHSSNNTTPSSSSTSYPGGRGSNRARQVCSCDLGAPQRQVERRSTALPAARVARECGVEAGQGEGAGTAWCCGRGE